MNEYGQSEMISDQLAIQDRELGGDDLVNAELVEKMYGVLDGILDLESEWNFPGDHFRGMINQLRADIADFSRPSARLMVRILNRGERKDADGGMRWVLLKGLVADEDVFNSFSWVGRSYNGPGAYYQEHPSVVRKAGKTLIKQRWGFDV